MTQVDLKQCNLYLECVLACNEQVPDVFITDQHKHTAVYGTIDVQVASIRSVLLKEVVVCTVL